MRSMKLAPFVVALSFTFTMVGCQQDNSKKPTVNVPTKEMNERTADDRVKEAEQAERDGNYQRAIEIYERLRSYPEASRPSDLDSRIKRVSDEMKRAATR